MQRSLYLLFVFFITSMLLAPLLAAQQQAAMLRSKVFQEGQRRSAKVLMKSIWSGNGSNFFAINLLNDKSVRDAWGVSDDQYKNIQGAMMKSMSAPESAAAIKEMGEFQKEQDLFTENGDTKKQERFLELQSQIVSSMMNTVPQEIDKALTPEQKKKIQEFQLASMGEVPIVSPQMFKALDLSDEQIKKMDNVSKELEPKFEKLVDGLIDTQIKLQNKVSEVSEKEGVDFKKDGAAAMKKYQEIAKRISGSDDEIRGLMDKLQSENQLFITQLKFKAYDILTDEQLAKLESIINNPPEYVTKFVKQMKEAMGRSGGGEAAGAVLDAWKPGEPIPAEYKQQRQKKAFPSKE